jgi:hypothetical protein
MDKLGLWDFDFIYDKDCVVRMLFVEIDGRLVDEMKCWYELMDFENFFFIFE